MNEQSKFTQITLQDQKDHDNSWAALATRRALAGESKQAAAYDRNSHK